MEIFGSTFARPGGHCKHGELQSPIKSGKLLQMEGAVGNFHPQTLLLFLLHINWAFTPFVPEFVHIHIIHPFSRFCAVDD